MKKLNYIILTLLSMFAMTWTACNDSIEWTVPEMSTEGRGVYFSNAESKVKMDSTASSFDVTILRSYNDCDETIALNVEDESGKFTIPTEVTFKKGKSSANITIGYVYDSATFPYDEYFNIKLSVADASKTFTYGYSTYEFGAGVPAPYKVVGLATYRDDIMTVYGLGIQTYEVVLEEHSLQQGIYRIRNPYVPEEIEIGNGEKKKLRKHREISEGIEAGSIMAFEGDHYININAQDPEGVFITQSNVGVDLGMGEHVVWSMGDYYVQAGNPFEVVKKAGYFGEMKDSVITFPTDGLINVLQGTLYYGNSNGAFVLAFPGIVVGEFNVDVDYMGYMTDASGELHTAVANITMGEDLSKAKDAMVKTDDFNAAYNAIVKGEIESQKITESQKLEFTLDEAGVYTIYAVGYSTDEETGEVTERESGYAQFEFTTGGSKWQSLGMAQYTEDIMPFYNSEIPNVTYEVEVQQSTETAGLYRLVYPYGAAYPLNEAGDYETSKNYYLEINAVDPQGVYIPMQAQGLDWGYGMLIVYSYAGYYLDGGNDFEAIKAAGYCGTLENGVITFPAGKLLATMVDLPDLYDTNNNGAFKVVLPGGAASSAAAQAKSTSFDLCASISKALRPNAEVAKFNAFKRVPNPRAKFIGR